ncbi:MAG: hypothetical protein ACE5HC_16045, partial [Candidatus Binatia bacterium]
ILAPEGREFNGRGDYRVSVCRGAEPLRFARGPARDSLPGRGGRRGLERWRTSYSGKFIRRSRSWKRSGWHRAP